MSRIRWIAVGATAGVWATLKAQEELKKRFERSKPEQLLMKVQNRAESLKETLRSATIEGIASARVELDRHKDD